LGPVTGFQGIEALRGFSDLRTFQEGDNSLAGASFSTGAVRMASPSILGRYEWIRKAFQAEVEFVDFGSSSMAVCELEMGMGSIDQGPY
jgi:hypothetical protein